MSPQLAPMTATDLRLTGVRAIMRAAPRVQPEPT
jgi:hypothetical protein